MQSLRIKMLSAAIALIAASAVHAQENVLNLYSARRMMDREPNGMASPPAAASSSTTRRA